MQLAIHLTHVLWTRNYMNYC